MTCGWCCCVWHVLMGMPCPKVQPGLISQLLMQPACQITSVPACFVPDALNSLVLSSLVSLHVITLRIIHSLACTILAQPCS